MACGEPRTPSTGSGADEHRPRSELAHRAGQGLRGNRDREALGQGLAVERQEMRVVEVVVGDAEDRPGARIAELPEQATVKRRGSCPAVVQLPHFAEHHALRAADRLVEKTRLAAGAVGARVVAEPPQGARRRNAAQARRGAEAGGLLAELDERRARQEKVLEAGRAHCQAPAWSRREISCRTSPHSPTVPWRTKRTDGYQSMRSPEAP